jgi:hypothetical protein
MRRALQIRVIIEGSAKARGCWGSEGALMAGLGGVRVVDWGCVDREVGGSGRLQKKFGDSLKIV